jgi:hypothetical protein
MIVFNGAPPEIAPIISNPSRGGTVRRGGETAAGAGCTGGELFPSIRKIYFSNVRLDTLADPWSTTPLMRCLYRSLRYLSLANARGMDV